MKEELKSKHNVTFVHIDSEGKGQELTTSNTDDDDKKELKTLSDAAYDWEKINKNLEEN